VLHLCNNSPVGTGQRSPEPHEITGAFGNYTETKRACLRAGWLLGRGFLLRGPGTIAPGHSRWGKRLDAARRAAERAVGGSDPGARYRARSRPSYPALEAPPARYLIRGLALKMAGRLSDFSGDWVLRSPPRHNRTGKLCAACAPPRAEAGSARIQRCKFGSDDSCSDRGPLPLRAFRLGERQIQLDAIVHDFRRDPAAGAAREPHQAVSLHGLERA
jgi:hypothetical protein